MDIVNRLKIFMDAHTIGSTQFADACRIPRPTLSQILSGRNKKISDEVISKIHTAYPRLSVLWLLFGEGQMESPANNAFSEPQKGGEIAAQPLPTNGFTASEKRQQSDAIEEDAGLFGISEQHEPLIFDDEAPMMESKPLSAPSACEEPVVTIPADGSKSIVNIMVFYSDNSYQSFVPR